MGNTCRSTFAHGQSCYTYCIEATTPVLLYRGGQNPIVHVEARIRAATSWANREGRKWAFSLSNAGAQYTEFRDKLDDLGELDWKAIDARDFTPQQVKEGKQAEFLMHEFFPWSLVARVGVMDVDIQARVSKILANNKQATPVNLHREWYF